MASQSARVSHPSNELAVAPGAPSRESNEAMTRRVGASTLRWFALSCLAITIASQTGCTLMTGLNNALAYSSATDDLVTGWRDTVWAKRAYNRRLPNLPVGQFESAFREGFIDGYHNVAQGGNGCQPAIPPRKYWSWKYQTAEGQCKVQAWYQGWSYGAKAAEEDGIGFYREIQVSGALEQSLRQHGYGVADPNCPNCPTNTIPYESAMPLPVIEGASNLPTGPRVDAAMPPSVRPQVFEVRPVSYEVERLPPVPAGQ